MRRGQYNSKANKHTDFVFDKSLSNSAKCINEGKSIEESIWKCGPPVRYGGYEKYNWCNRSHTLHSKDIRYCSCGCQLRTTSKYKFGTNQRKDVLHKANHRKL